MTDLCQGQQAGLDSPATGIEAVTYDQDLSYLSRGLWVGADGNVSVITSRGETVTIVGVKQGTLLPIRIKRVASSGTTVAAASLFSFY